MGIGPKLASNINTENKKAFSSYLTHRIITSFSFTLVDQRDIETHISSLKTETSFGIDGISTKFLKFLSPALTKPLFIIINQSLATGIFPTKLKIAKVLPLLKKDDSAIMDNYRPVYLLPSMSKVFEKLLLTNCTDIFRTITCSILASMAFKENTPQNLQR